MTPEEKKARECLVIYLDPGEHDNSETQGFSLVSIWRLKTIEKISLALQQAYNEGLARGAEIAKNIPSISLGGTTYEILSQVATAIRKEKR